MLVVGWDEQEEPHIPGELSKGHSQSQPLWPTATVMTSRAAHRFKGQLGVAVFLPHACPCRARCGDSGSENGSLGDSASLVPTKDMNWDAIMGRRTPGSVMYKDLASQTCGLSYFVS